MRADEVCALQGGIDFRGQSRWTGLRCIRSSGDGPQERLTGHRDQQRQAKRALHAVDTGKCGERRTWIGAEKEAHAWINDYALTRNSRALQDSKSSLEETNDRINDVRDR